MANQSILQPVSYLRSNNIIIVNSAKINVVGNKEGGFSVLIQRNVPILIRKPKKQTKSERLERDIQFSVLQTSFITKNQAATCR